MSCKAPGKAHRKGITAKEFYQKFPDEATAEEWFRSHRWPDGIRCPHCGSANVQTKTAHKTMPFRCQKRKDGGCGRFFSTKTGTFMARSNVSYQEWLFAIYLVVTNLKSVSSMKVHRELKRSQRTAWYLVHRIRNSWKMDGSNLFEGPVECDETYFGGRRRNMPKSVRANLTGRGAIGKVAVVGVRDRATNRVSAQVVQDTEGDTLKGFVMGKVVPGTTIYTDDARAYTNLPNHQAVKHSVAEYVRNQVHTNGIESFWATLKRAHKGTFHRLSPKHLHRYVDEFVGRHNMREMDTLEQMAAIAQRMENAQLRYRDLVGSRREK